MSMIDYLSDCRQEGVVDFSFAFLFNLLCLLTRYLGSNACIYAGIKEHSKHGSEDDVDEEEAL